MMFGRNAMNAVPVAAAAVLFALSSAPIAQAQGGGGGRFPGMGGRRGGPMMQRQQGALSLDPSHTTISYLLSRIDVRRELLLDGRQREKLLASIQQTQNDLAAKQNDTRMQLRQQMRQSGQNFRNMTPEERQAAQQDMAQKMNEVLNPAREQQDKTLEAILTPWQIQRLHQLDLQWRTAMALVDPKVGDPFALSQEQGPKINEVVQGFRTAQGEATRAVFQSMRPTAALNAAPPANPAPGTNNPNRANGNTQNGANGSTPNGATAGRGARPVFDPEAMRSGFLIAEKQAEKRRVADNARVFALLTTQQKQKWLTSIGKLFYFQPGNQTAQE